MPVFTPVKHMPRHRYPYQVRERVRKGVSLARLLANSTRMVDMHNSMYVKPFKVEKLKDLEGRPVFRGYTHTNDPRFPPERDHTPTIRPKDKKYKGKISTCPSVVVECSCLTGDTRVLTDKGYQTIFSLLNPFSDHLREEPITYVINDKKAKGTVPFYTGKKPVYEVYLDNGSRLKLTKDHRVLIYEGKKTQRTYIKKGRKQSGSLNNNSYIWKVENTDGSFCIVNDMKQWCKDNGLIYSSVFSATSRGKPFNGLIITKWRKDRRGLSASVEFTETYSNIKTWKPLEDIAIGDKVVIHDVKKIPRISKDLAYWQSYVFGAFHGDGTLNPFSITCRSNPRIISFFKKAGVVAKHIGNDRYQLYKEAKAILHTMGCLNKNRRHFIDVDKINIFGFLSGLLDSDGYLHDKTAKFYGCKQLRKVADRLKEMGVHGVKIKICRRKGEATNKGIANRHMFRLSISHQGFRQIIQNLDGDKVSKLLPRLRGTSEVNRLNVSKVKNIVYKGVMDVYDITVPSLNMFVAESAIVHNCARFTFLWEYADALRSDGLIWHGNGEPPLITNPQNFPALCIAEGELVLTYRGYIRIEDVKVGDKVWTLKGWKKVTASQYMGTKNVVTIKLKSGRTLSLTPDHKVYTFKDGGLFDWVEAKDLSNSHSLCMTTAKNTKPYRETKTMSYFKYRDRVHNKRNIRTDARLSELYGYMTAEGSERCFAGCNLRLVTHFKDLWDSVFGKNVCSEYSQGVTLSSHSYSVFKSFGFIEGSYNKDIPDWIMQSDNKTIIAFIRGAYAGDGNFRGRHSTYATVSEVYARKLHLLMDRLGVRASLRCYKSGINNVDTWVVRTSSAEQTFKLSKILNPIRGFSSVLVGEGGVSYWNRINNPIKSIETALLSSFKYVENSPYLFLTDYCNGKSLDLIARKLRSSGKLIKKRIRSGGKPNNVARKSDIDEAYYPTEVRKFISGINLRREYGKNKDVISDLLPRIKSFSKEAYYKLSDMPKVDLDRVDSVIGNKEKRRVYDLTVEDAEHFTANGYVVHNCKHLISLSRWLKARGL